MSKINLPKFGTGMRPILRGSAIKVGTPVGKLRVGASNIASSGRGIKQLVSAGKVKAANDAKTVISNLIRVKT